MPGKRRLPLAVGMILGAWINTFAAGPQVPIVGRIPADFPANLGSPVVVPIPEALAGRTVLRGELEVDGASAGSVLLQTEPADQVAGTPARAWFIWTATPAQIGKPVSMELTPAAASAEAVCRLRYVDPFVEVAGADNGLILKYRHGETDPAQPKAMTSYIHPLVGLDGEILTDCSPSDHLHHRGLFWAWVRLMRDDDLLAETWIARDIALKPADVKVSEGPVLGRFAARHYWVHQPESPYKPATRPSSHSDRLFQEDVVCRVFDTAGGGRAVDIDLTLTALQDNLRIGGQTQLNKGYGGLTLRFGTEQSGAKEPRVEADGKPITAATLNHLKARWVDWTGVFNGPDGRPLPRRSGGTVFVHPSHPPLPESAPEWITRFYGPINVAYPGLEMLDVPQDRPMRLKYRIWIHRGDAAEGRVAEQYRAYAADWEWHTQN